MKMMTRKELSAAWELDTTEPLIMFTEQLSTLGTRGLRSCTSSITHRVADFSSVITGFRSSCFTCLPFSSFTCLSFFPDPRFLSKCCEKVVASQFISHLRENKLQEIFQSAYKVGHSTESALLRVHNDALRALDDGKCVMLVLLDLSAAFDTVDHGILLSRLSQCIGVQGSAYTWFESYLSSRSQFVQIRDTSSSDRQLTCGLPQGSVLGPILYLVYTSPLGAILRRHGVGFHMYADDTQLYLSMKTTRMEDVVSARTRVEVCLRELNQWMLLNNLRLNNDKTELLVLHAKHRPKPPLDSITVGDATVEPKSSAWNIGAIFDDTMSFEEHVNDLCKTAFYHIRNISRIRSCLSIDSTKTLVHVLVMSLLDHCNSLLYGLPDYLIQRLQYVMNAAAEEITCKQKLDHVTPLLIELHWLPVRQRIIFKILLYTFKALHGAAPTYLTELISPYVPRRALRSADQLLLEQPTHKLKLTGLRAFSVCAPYLWNSVPFEIKSSASVSIFKAKLKTYLFRQAYF